MTELLAPHQRRNWKHTIGDFHRWNISEGATRSGKTYVDFYKIPWRIRHADKDGIIVLLGNTQGTLERNILEPLRSIWGKDFVGTIGGASSRVHMFGRDVYALGADKKTSVAKIQGSSIAYCYGDEIATWAEPVFQMLKSRLDRPTSCFDGTTNPDNPQHWLHKFLKSDANIYRQRFTLDENPYVSEFFKEQLKKEYSGTVYYDRFILGKWRAAEGIIYRAFADHFDKFLRKERPDPKDTAFCTIGVDFGGTKSAQAFQCTAFSKDLSRIETIDEYYTKDPLDPVKLAQDFADFLQVQLSRGYFIQEIRADSAESVLLRGLQAELDRRRLPYRVLPARKTTINDRIRFYCMLQSLGRYSVHVSCNHTVEAFCTATWRPYVNRDERLDDGTYNIDSLDAQEYSTESYQKQMIRLITFNRGL